MISTHLKKFRSTILAAVALLAIIGTVVALPDSAEAGRREPTITSVDMTITPTAVSTQGLQTSRHILHLESAT